MDSARALRVASKDDQRSRAEHVTRLRFFTLPSLLRCPYGTRLTSCHKEGRDELATGLREAPSKEDRQSCPNVKEGRRYIHGGSIYLYTLLSVRIAMEIRRSTVRSRNHIHHLWLGGRCDPASEVLGVMEALYLAI